MASSPPLRLFLGQLNLASAVKIYQLLSDYYVTISTRLALGNMLSWATFIPLKASESQFDTLTRLAQFPVKSVVSVTNPQQQFFGMPLIWCSTMDVRTVRSPASCSLRVQIKTLKLESGDCDVIEVGQAERRFPQAFCCFCQALYS